MSKRLGLALAAVSSLLAFAPTPAHAGGLEFAGPGTTALGRGGAAYARPGDPMALWYNPANLADLQGIQLSLQTHLVMYEACHRREGTYGSYSGVAANDPTTMTELERFNTGIAADPGERSAFEGMVPDGELPNVCNSAPPGIVPELVLSWRAHKRVGIGIGFVAPAAPSHVVYGETTRIGDQRYVGTVNGLPSPTRYNLIEQQLLAGWPTVGVGVNVHKRFRIGGAFGFGFALAEFDSIVRAIRGEEFAGDVRAQLSMKDMFVPRITVSAHAVPHDNLDVSFTFSWTDDVRASGDVTLTSGYYRAERLERLRISGATLDVPQPWQMALGIRYADRIVPRPESADEVAQLSRRVEDPMSNERFDVEVNVVYERNSNVDQYSVSMGNCAEDRYVAEDLGGSPLTSSNCGGMTASGAIPFAIEADAFLSANLPENLVIPHNWKDSLSIRVGGDYNIMPGLAAIRLGFSFETKGIEDGFEQLDFLPFMRFGAHVGLTMRLGMFDVSLAYAHIHQFNTTVSLNDAGLKQINAEERLAELSPDPDDRPLAGPGTIINGGRFTSNFDVVSLGLTYHFR
ncbi:MAG: hypothetical protein R3B99_09105 [Polyangiales bacterium]